MNIKICALHLSSQSWTHFLFHCVRVKFKSNLFGKASPSLENKTLYIYLFIYLFLHNFIVFFHYNLSPLYSLTPPPIPLLPTTITLLSMSMSCSFFSLLLHPSVPLNPYSLSCQPAPYLCKHNKDRFTGRRLFFLHLWWSFDTLYFVYIFVIKINVYFQFDLIYAT